MQELLYQEKRIDLFLKQKIIQCEIHILYCKAFHYIRKLTSSYVLKIKASLHKYLCSVKIYLFSLFNPKMSNSFLVHILRNWKEKSPRVVLIYKRRKEVNRPKNFIFSKDCCVKCRTFILGFKFISVFIF